MEVQLAHLLLLPDISTQYMFRGEVFNDIAIAQNIDLFIPNLAVSSPTTAYNLVVKLSSKKELTCHSVQCFKSLLRAGG